jgi:Na+/phosphate symporter
VTKAIPRKSVIVMIKVFHPQYLDDRVLDTPTVALTNASREVLRIADLTDQMLAIGLGRSKREMKQSIVEKIQRLTRC